MADKLTLFITKTVKVRENYINFVYTFCGGGGGQKDLLGLLV